MWFWAHNVDFLECWVTNQWQNYLFEHTAGQTGETRNRVFVEIYQALQSSGSHCNSFNFMLLFFLHNWLYWLNTMVFFPFKFVTSRWIAFQILQGTKSFKLYNDILHYRFFSSLSLFVFIRSYELFVCVCFVWYRRVWTRHQWWLNSFEPLRNEESEGGSDWWYWKLIHVNVCLYSD